MAAAIGKDHDSWVNLIDSSGLRLYATLLGVKKKNPDEIRISLSPMLSVHLFIRLSLVLTWHRITAGLQNDACILSLRWVTALQWQSTFNRSDTSNNSANDHQTEGWVGLHKREMNLLLFRLLCRRHLEGEHRAATPFYHLSLVLY